MDTIYAAETEKLCLEIDEYVKKEFNYRSRCANRMFGTINVNVKKADLYFRYKLVDDTLWDNNTFVIARMGFEDPRIEFVKPLLKFLCGLSGKYRFNKIGMEQANVFEEYAAVYFGFKRIEGHHWIATVEDLKKTLRKRNV